MAVKELNYPFYFVDLDDRSYIIGFRRNALTIHDDRTFRLDTPVILITGKIVDRTGRDIYVQDSYTTNGVEYGKREFRLETAYSLGGKSKRLKTKRRKMKQRKTRNKN